MLTVEHYLTQEQEALLLLSWTNFQDDLNPKKFDK
jgi:hypothetical protein